MYFFCKLLLGEGLTFSMFQPKSICVVRKFLENDASIHKGFNNKSVLSIFVGRFWKSRDLFNADRLPSTVSQRAGFVKKTVFLVLKTSAGNELVK